MRFGSCVQPVDRVCGDLNCRIKSEREVSSLDVIINGFGTPRIGIPCSLNNMSPTVRDPFPPITINPSIPRSDIVDRTRSTPSALSNGLPRFVPSTVPPRGRVPRIVSTVSGRVRRSISPSHASAKPMISSPKTRSPFRTIARMTAFKPGQSPPPVRTPKRTFRRICLMTDRTNAWLGIAVVRFRGSDSSGNG